MDFSKFKIRGLLSLKEYFYDYKIYLKRKFENLIFVDMPCNQTFFLKKDINDVLQLYPEISICEYKNFASFIDFENILYENTHKLFLINDIKYTNEECTGDVWIRYCELKEDINLYII
jgi:hypothetical protein